MTYQYQLSALVHDHLHAIYKCLCCAFMPVYLSLSLVLWTCANLRRVIVLSCGRVVGLVCRCVFVLFACGPCLRAGRGIVVYLTVSVMGSSCRDHNTKRSLFPRV
jgi:peptidoglycan biosynthesis protein MviN/MurJ (putative lipid II flippase)